jgi:hypothetical protein
MLHICSDCNVVSINYFARDGPALGQLEVSCLDSALRTSQLTVFNRVSIPEGQDGPFRGRITNEDVDLLRKIEKVTEFQMMDPENTSRWRGNPILEYIHRSIERAEIDFLEDGFQTVASLHRGEAGLFIPVLLKLVKAEDLAEDERQCHIYMEDYVDALQRLMDVDEKNERFVQAKEDIMTAIRLEQEQTLKVLFSGDGSPTKNV